MNEEIRLNRIGTAFEDLEYPVRPPAVAAAYEGVEVRLAEGTVAVDEVIAESNADQFASKDDPELEFLNLLPRNAVGEPFQSDGDA